LEQEALLATQKQEELTMQQTYSTLVADSDEKKYQDLLKNLQDYKDERDRLLSEQKDLEALLTTQEIQDAINEGKKTETQLILDKYNLQKQTLDDELTDYRSQLDEKLKALSTFY
jgi:molecular chaperone DnaK (HSP70)